MATIPILSGAMLILVEYAAHQVRRIKPRRGVYNSLKAIGSASVRYIDFHLFQVGFVVLELTWTLISIYAVLPPAGGGMKPSGVTAASVEPAAARWGASFIYPMRSQSAGAL